MRDYLVYLLLGIGSGAIYSVLATGLVVQFRGANVVNFGYAAMMMTSTLVYVGVRNDGIVVLPVPGVPDIRIADGPGSVWAAFAAAVLVSLAVALAAHLLVFRHLRDAPALCRVAAGVGLMLTLQAVAVLQYGTVNAVPRGVLPSSIVTVLGARVPVDRLLLGGIAVLVAVTLWAFFRFTTLGMAIRGAAENERGASILGWSPDRLALITWLGAAALAGVVGVLIAPITSVDRITYTLLIIPALGAALVARFKSFTICVAAALGLGMAQSLLTKLAAEHSWVPQVGIQDGVPFLVMIVVMAVGGRLLPARGSTEELRHPVAYAPRNVATRAVVLISCGAALVVLTSGGARFALIASMTGTLLALSVVVVTGFTGLISLSQFAFAGVAGFVLSKLAADVGVPFPIAPLLASLVAALLGVLIGLPALRFRGINLAIITLAAGAAVNSLAFQNPDYTGGYDGSPIPRPHLFGWDLGIDAGHGEASLSYALVCLAVVAAVCVAVSNLRRSATGRRMLAVRANERAAAATGVDVARVKLLAFGLSAFIAGLAGTFIAYQQVSGNLSFDGFGPLASVVLIAGVFVGGVSTVAGAVIAGVLGAGGVAFYVLSRKIGAFREWQALVGGIGLMLVAVRQPDGIAGYNIAHMRALRARLRPPRTRTVPAVAARAVD